MGGWQIATTEGWDMTQATGSRNRPGEETVKDIKRANRDRTSLTRRLDRPGQLACRSIHNHGACAIKNHKDCGANLMSTRRLGGSAQTRIFAADRRHDAVAGRPVDSADRGRAVTVRGRHAFVL
jgi:hypothetical protein